jgi:cobalt-zinc-cadmium efflux system outer membrane protein
VSYDSETVRRDTILEVTQLYWELAEAQEVVKLNGENLSYLETLDKAIRRQVEVGATPGSQVIKSEVELARARQQLAQSQLELTNARAALAVLLNCPADREFTASDPLVCRAVSIDRSRLIADALERRPEVLSKRELVEAGRGQVSAARARRIPDLALEARKESFDGGDSGIALSVTLPLLDWGSAKSEKRSAEIATAARLKELEATGNAVVLDVERAVQALETATRVVREYEDGILDKSAQLAAMARKGYEKGALNYLDVLEAQRTLRSVRTEYVSAVAEQSKAIALLEWATGADLGRAEVKK